MAGKKKVPEQVQKVDTKELFGDFDFSVPGDEEETTVSAKLDLFKDILPAIENKDYGYYGRLTKEQKKDYQPFIIQRWLSNSNDNYGLHHYYVSTVNATVNYRFWDVSNHPELQHKLLCACASGEGARVRHNWLPFITGKRKKSVIRDFFRNSDKNLNDTELDLLIANINDAEFLKLLESQGLQDSEIKGLMKEWKAEKKK